MLETIFCMVILRPTAKLALLDSQALVWSIVLDHEANILGPQGQMVYTESLFKRLMMGVHSDLWEILMVDSGSLATQVWEWLSLLIDVICVGTAKSLTDTLWCKNRVPFLKFFEVFSFDCSSCLAKVELVKSAGEFTCPRAQYLISMVCL